ncbi:MAG TPA: cobalamin biosynthesis protein [Candidatus Limnocylindrales bacterium]|nr:cobalamin biosynthesis protein [Candidatus Limnocylindrales bacterium]
MNWAGLVAGYALDVAFGDPRRFHPVAGYGRLAGGLEKAVYAPDRLRGTAFAAAAVGAPILAARLAPRRPAARFVLTALATWSVLGGRSLAREGSRLADELSAGDLAAARRRLPNLCGRDPSALDSDGIARAGVESLAENTSDAVVGPLVWGALLGLPGLVGYRAINTLDAMVGHKSPRYEHFGTAAARLDDLANLVPSRLTAALAAALAPLVGGSARRAWSTWLRDGARHPSPNSGQCEAAFAGALGVRLGGTNVYSGRAETRPDLGSGPGPGAAELRRAACLSTLVGLGALALAAAASKSLSRRMSSHGRSRHPA